MFLFLFNFTLVSIGKHKYNSLKQSECFTTAIEAFLTQPPICSNEEVSVLLPGEAVLPHIC